MYGDRAAAVEMGSCLLTPGGPRIHLGASEGDTHPYARAHMHIFMYTTSMGMCVSANVYVCRLVREATLRGVPSRFPADAPGRRRMVKTTAPVTGQQPPHSPHSQLAGPQLAQAALDRAALSWIWS